MEQINTIELKDEKVYPDENVLKTVLQESYSVYRQLLKIYDENDLVSEWRYYKDGKAWLCKVQKKTRTIVWMSAWKGFMKATIYFPEKYIDGLYHLEISEAFKQKVTNTRNVGKSKPCMFEIRDEGIFSDFKVVLNYKLKSR